MRALLLLLPFFPEALWIYALLLLLVVMRMYIPLFFPISFQPTALFFIAKCHVQTNSEILHK